jgi:hypothetical protein
MGNGGVDSSILSGSTIPRAKNPDFADRKRYRPIARGQCAFLFHGRDPVRHFPKRASIAFAFCGVNGVLESKLAAV